MTPANDTPAVKVWYDSQCPLCIREIDLMRRLDTRGAIEFIDLYTAQGCPVDRGELLRRFHAQEAGRPVVSGGFAWQFGSLNDSFSNLIWPQKATTITKIS